MIATSTSHTSRRKRHSRPASPRRARALTSLAAAAVVAAATLSGCAATSPASYETFDQWAVGDPEVYQLDKGAESRPQIYRMLYGPFVAIPLIGYDAGRIVASPFVWTYYAARGLDRSDDRHDEGGESATP